MNGRVWTAADTQTLERMAGRYTDEEIAARTGHAKVTVYYRRRLLDLPATMRRKDRLMLDAAVEF